MPSPILPPKVIVPFAVPLVIVNPVRAVPAPIFPVIIVAAVPDTKVSAWPPSIV